MVTLTRLYTRGGDGGQTSLGNGDRRGKDDVRVEAYGAVDESNATLGVARLHLSGDLDAVLVRIQNDLFDLGADLCCPDAPADKSRLRILPEQVAALERAIDHYNAALTPLNSFILPAGSPAAVALHLARTVVRRAERRVATLATREPINPEALKYLNRLSDLLFVFARRANRDGADDVLWCPGGKSA